MVREQIRVMGLTGNVSLLGQRRDIASILRASDIGVLSSNAEGLPLALLEYGAAALPVVVTSVGQCAEVVDHGNAGISVQPGNSRQIADALLRLLRSADDRAFFGRALASRVEARYSAGAVMECVYATYDQVLGVSERRMQFVPSHAPTALSGVDS